MRNPSIAALLVALAALPLAGAAPVPKPAAGPAAQPASPEPHLPAPRYLPAAARELLVDRMKNHRADLTALTASVIVLDRRGAEAMARSIAAEPRLARPVGAGDDLNSLLPPRFFDLQEELRHQATLLADAAKAGNDAKLALAFGKLQESCVSCHAVYLNPGP